MSELTAAQKAAAMAKLVSELTPSDADTPLTAWARGFVHSAAAQLHDVNNHLAWEGNRPTEPPFDWTTNCQHGDCKSAREWLAARSSPAPAEGLDACSMCGSRDRWLHYVECGHYYGGASLGRAAHRNRRTDWSNVVVDEGDEAP